MPIKLTGVVETLDSVPEAFKAAYEQKDGKFHLKEVEFEDPAEVTKKLTKKEALLTDANKKLGRYTKFAEFTDDDLDDLLNLRELKKSGKPLTVDEKAELERLHKKATEKLGGDLKAREEQITTLERDLRHYKLTVPLRDIAVKAGVIAEDLDLVMLDVQSRFKLDENGKIVVLDSDGDVSDVTPQKFFETLYKEQRPKFYKASDAGGSGAHNDKKGGGAVSAAEFLKLSPAEQLKRARESGSKE